MATPLLVGVMIQRDDVFGRQETSLVMLENEMAKAALEMSNTVLREEHLRGSLLTIDDDIRQNNEIITRCEVEVMKRNATIERKQSVIDKCNKRLEVMLSKTGVGLRPARPLSNPGGLEVMISKTGVDLCPARPLGNPGGWEVEAMWRVFQGEEVGPMELTVNSLHKSVIAEQEEIAEMQQMWMREQSELVQLTKDYNKQSSDVENTKKAYTILTNKKFRIESRSRLLASRVGQGHMPQIQSHVLVLAEQNWQCRLKIQFYFRPLNIYLNFSE